MTGLIAPGPRGWGPLAWPALAIAWLGGIGLELHQPELWAPPVYAALAIAGLACAILGRRSAALAAIGVAALAFGSTGWRAAERLAETLPPALVGQDLVVTGVVADLPRTSAQGLRFVFEVDRAERLGQPVRVPERVSLGWYGDHGDAAPLPDLRAGQRWRLPVRLRPPHGTLNPQGFDLELWLFTQRIRASGYVRVRADAPATQLPDPQAHPVERLRQDLRDAIERRVADPAAAGVLAALAVGDQAAIDRDDWDLFRATGVAHLMSISGLHVTMFAWLAGAAIGALWRRGGRLMLALPAPLAARWGGLAVAAAYALLAGWGVPAQRTLGMIAGVALLRSLGLRWPLPAVLLAAAVGVTAFDPWALLQPGFWLSFVAVALLIVSEPGAAGTRAPQRWFARAAAALRGGLRTQLVATVGLAPLTLVFFNQISLVGFAANLVAIPVVTLLVTPLALLGVAWPALWRLDAVLVHALMAWLGWLAASPLAVWSTAAAPLWAVAAGLFAGLLAVLPLPWRLRALALPLMLPLLWPAVQRPAPGRFETLAADIGQGTAVLVRTTNHLLVYDAGPQYSAQADAGERVLLPLLRARGERHVDLLMLSHRDTDHVGGAAALIDGLPVRALASSLADGHPLLASGRPHQRCSAGQSWTWDGVRFDVLHPLAADYAGARKPNALSCVLRVQGAGAALLLTGDIEAAQEAALLARGAALKSEVLVVPHHGSKTSSTPAFIDAVAPRVAVVQAGWSNRFGHPAPEVLARYAERGIRIVRSDRCGAWTLPAGTAPEGGAVCERQAVRRYWHHRISASGS